MKERGIIFNTEMVRAILDGRKTQTRRVIKPQPHGPNPPGSTLDFFSKRNKWVGAWDIRKQKGNVECPYGVPGDRLYLREAFARTSHQKQKPQPPRDVVYKADSEKMFYDFDRNWKLSDFNIKWTSSRFMPKAIARIWLEIVNVRVERVQDISATDARAEGDKERSGMPEFHARGPLCHVDWFRQLWNRLNTNRGYGWEQNPHVWVIEFRRAK